MKSPKFEKVKAYFEGGLWDKHRLANAVAKGWITQAEFDEIVTAGGEADA